MKIDEVILHHKNCDIRRCQTCLNDASKLEMYLHQQIDKKRKHDVLGHYRTWLDKHGIESENEHGWILPSAYEKENIKGFIKDFRKQ